MYRQASFRADLLIMQRTVAGYSLARRVVLLSVAAVVASSRTTASPEWRVSPSSVWVDLQTAIASHADDHDRGTVFGQAQRAVDQAIDDLERALGNPAAPCDDQGVVYLSSNANLDLHGYAVLAVQIEGNHGSWQFAFASGTAQPNLIAAVNSVSMLTGIAAAEAPENPSRVQLTAITFGGDGFVRVRYDRYPWNLLAESAHGPVIASDLKDLGADGVAGDANCDFLVDHLDLQSVVNNWGACDKAPPACLGDVDLSGTVDVNDLLLVIHHWGKPKR